MVKFNTQIQIPQSINAKEKIIKLKNLEIKRGKKYKAYIFTTKRRRMGAVSDTESSSNELQDDQEGRDVRRRGEESERLCLRLCPLPSASASALCPLPPSPSPPPPRPPVCESNILLSTKPLNLLMF